MLSFDSRLPGFYRIRLDHCTQRIEPVSGRRNVLHQHTGKRHCCSELDAPVSAMAADAEGGEYIRADSGKHEHLYFQFHIYFHPALYRTDDLPRASDIAVGASAAHQPDGAARAG